VAIVVADRPRLSHVGAVHGEAGDHFLDRRDQAVEREVAEVPVALREAIQLVAERVDVARHRLVHHLLLAAIGEIGKRQSITAFADEAAVDPVERPFVACVDEQVVDGRCELVAGCALNRPFRR